ncbi:MAG: hypothetical protein WB947_07315 [Thermoplasmata archaeon]
MNVESSVLALLTDPSYGIPLVVAVGLTGAMAWWSQLRTANPPKMAPSLPPELWRIQIDSRAFFTLQEGKYLVAVDGLGRRLGTVVNNRFHVQIGQKRDLDAPAVDHALPAPLTLRGLVADLSRAYYSAFWAEQPGWLAGRWAWLRRRNQRRAARDFRRITAELAQALPALES